MQNNFLYSDSIFLYRGSTFDAILIPEDIHGNPYYLSKGERVFFFIEKDLKNNSINAESDQLKVVLTSDDEINGVYPFKLSHETTKNMDGDYTYYAFIQFANGDYYQIVPHTHLRASAPYFSVDYWENKNTIHAKIPRVMRKCECECETSDHLHKEENI